jgi:proton-dependent oligopeptide transporter, POT family
MSVAIDKTGASGDDRTDTGGIGGHPRGLTTLFFTEMWERFSYYGMRAILFLYMTKGLAEGGLAFDQKYAGLIMGTYTSGVYWTPLIGGWLADKYIGARRAVLVGGIIIACGHFSLAFDSMPTFYTGLVLIVIGTGFLKPNVSTMVGNLYTEKDKRRDAGFSIFYMGINLGALLAPLVVGFLAQRESFKRFLTSMGFDPLKSWHWGFGAACVFMVFGLIQYVAGRDRLRAVGEKPVKKEHPDIAQTQKIGDEVGGKDFDALTAVLAIAGGVLGFLGGMRWSSAGWVGGLFPAVMFFFFGYIAGTMRRLNRTEARRVGVIIILFVFSVIFWMSFEQAATSLTLFADRLTHNYIFGHEFESSYYQSVQPFFIVVLAPVFALIWQKMGDRDPSSPAKFSVGLFFAAAAFGIIAFASTLIPATGGAELTEAQKVSPLWLVVVYFFQTLGELCLSPVGLSTVTKLSPTRLVGLMMGVWFLSISIGDFVAGIMGGMFDEKAEGALVKLFGTVAVITVIAAIILALLTPIIKRITARAESLRS